VDASIGLRDLAFDEPFDAAVGRLVLMYLADPAETLRRATGRVRLGGIVALQRYTFADLGLSFSRAALYERTGTLVNETFRRAGSDMQMGLKLFCAFIAAGYQALSHERRTPHWRLCLSQLPLLG
jgi:hypothetical protein